LYRGIVWISSKYHKDRDVFLGVMLQAAAYAYN